MKATTISTLAPLCARLNLRLAACALTAAAISGMATTAQASIVYADPADISIPNSVTNGIYLNLVTGDTFRPSQQNPLQFNADVYGGGVNGAIIFGTPSEPGAGAVCDPAITAYSSVLALAAGTTIGPSSYLRSGQLSAPDYYVEGTEYLGLSFTNEATGAINYGWVRVSTTAPNAAAGTRGLPAFFIDYAYENTGAPILAGAVPEPSTWALMTVGAGLLACGVARHRTVWAASGSARTTACSTC